MKKMVALFLSLLLLCAPLWVSAVESKESVDKGYLGDVNLDGAVNARDALCILRYAVGKDSLSLGALHAAQTNDDTLVNAVDALNILKYAVGKESVLYQGMVQTQLLSNNAYAYWTAVQDGIFSTQQAWLCQTYEEYKAFLQLGYVVESERKTGFKAQTLTPEFDADFFETHGLVLWYRVSDMSTGSLHYKGAFVKGSVLYLDVVPYLTDALDDSNALDVIYGFYFEKGDTSVTTVVMRKCAIGDIYRKYFLSQFDFS